MIAPSYHRADVARLRDGYHRAPESYDLDAPCICAGTGKVERLDGGDIVPATDARFAEACPCCAPPKTCEQCGERCWVTLWDGATRRCGACLGEHLSAYLGVLKGVV